MTFKNAKLLALLLCFIVVFTSCSTQETSPALSDTTAYSVLNNNVPEFSESEITTTSFEEYSDLDYLGRCGVAFACIGKDIMPTEERGAIGQIKPSGWHLAKYDIVDGKYLYNRCHLIGYQLSGENANEKNLITGTRFLNNTGMLPFENMVADYVQRTGNHVMYRVTPVFEGNNLVAKGVKMEALSVEDDGKGISFNVFVNNIQPDVIIDYRDGSSSLESDPKPEPSVTTPAQNDSSVTAKPDPVVVAPTPTENESQDIQSEDTYILNKNSKKFHYPSCPSADDIKPSNKETYNGSRDSLIEKNYSPCKRCDP